MVDGPLVDPQDAELNPALLGSWGPADPDGTHRQLVVGRHNLGLESPNFDAPGIIELGGLGFHAETQKLLSLFGSLDGNTTPRLQATSIRIGSETYLSFFVDGNAPVYLRSEKDYLRWQQSEQRGCFLIHYACSGDSLILTQFSTQKIEALILSGSLESKDAASKSPATAPSFTQYLLKNGPKEILDSKSPQMWTRQL